MYLYIVKNEVGRVKVGVTSDLKTRLRQIETASGLELKEKFYVESDNKEQLEKELLAKFGENRTIGEWFDINIWKIINYLERFNFNVKTFSDKDKISLSDLIDSFNKLEREEKKEFRNFVLEENKISVKEKVEELFNFIEKTDNENSIINCTELYETVKELGYAGSFTAFGRAIRLMGIGKKQKRINEKFQRFYVGVKII